MGVKFQPLENRWPVAGWAGWLQFELGTSGTPEKIGVSRKKVEVTFLQEKMPSGMWHCRRIMHNSTTDRTLQYIRSLPITPLPYLP